MFSQKELGDFELGLAALSEGNRRYAEDFFTALQVAFSGKFEDFSVGGILNVILPPGRSDEYKDGYCPPYSVEIFSIMDSLFSFSLADRQAGLGDYKNILVTRQKDQREIVITIKVPVDFGSHEFQKRLDFTNVAIEKKKKSVLATIRQKGSQLTDWEFHLLRRIDA